MATPRPSSALPGFNRLSSCVLLYTPPQKSTAPPSYASATGQATPDLIVMCTWMGASLRHVNKYLQLYKEHYPSSTIVITTNNWKDIVFRGNALSNARLRPALEVIQMHAQIQGPAQGKKPVILLHIFSNGGANQACSIASGYRKLNNAPLPVSGMVLDSCPGSGGYSRGLVAMSVSLPRNLLLRLLSLILVHFILSALWFCHHIVGMENVVHRVRRSLNNDTLFPKQTPRMYVYSETDKMIGFDDVEAHAKEAEEKGWEVQRCKFTESKHVEHLMEDASKYWSAVEQVLEPAVAPVRANGRLAPRTNGQTNGKPVVDIPRRSSSRIAVASTG